jgi:hypothetical protein
LSNWPVTYIYTGVLVIYGYRRLALHARSQLFGQQWSIRMLPMIILSFPGRALGIASHSKRIRLIEISPRPNHGENPLLLPTRMPNRQGRVLGITNHARKQVHLREIPVRRARRNRHSMPTLKTASLSVIEAAAYCRNFENFASSPDRPGRPDHPQHAPVQRDRDDQLISFRHYLLGGMYDSYELR